MTQQGLNTFEVDLLREKELAELPRITGTSSPITASKLEEINYRAPWLSPETSYALAQANASSAAIDYAAEISARRDIADSASRYGGGTADVGESFIADRIYDATAFGRRMLGKVIGSTFGAAAKGVIRGTKYGYSYIDPALEATGVKNISRFGFAALEGVKETIANLGSVIQLRKQGKRDLRGWWDTTSIGLFFDNPELRGDGWFVGEAFRKEQERRAQDFRGKIYGQGYTVGRGVASILIPEKNLAYGLLSGAIDAALLVQTDPTGPISKGITKGLRGVGYLASPTGRETIGFVLRGGSRTMPLLTAEDLKYAKKLRSEAGLVKNLTETNINYGKWREWMTSHPLAVRLTKKLVDTTSVREILEDIFNFNITTDVAANLAKAKTTEEVLAAFENAAVLGETALRGNFGKYVSLRHGLGVGDIFEKNRWFTKVPKGHVVTTGNPVDNIKAIKNLIYTMRLGGVDPKNIDDFVEYAVKEFGEFGTPTGRNTTLEIFTNYMDNILEANGVDQVIREDILGSGRKQLDRVHNWMLNRQGVNTDNGLIRGFYEAIKDAKISQPELAASMLEDMTNAELAGDIRLLQPLEIAKLLDRVFILPDPRELRRVTRNPFLRKLLSSKDEADIVRTRLGKLSGGGQGPEFVETAGARIKKLPITSRRKLVNSKIISDKQKWRTLKNLLDEKEEVWNSRGKPKDLKGEIDAIRTEMDNLEIEERIWALSGKQRNTLRALEFVQNQIWKPLNLMTGGYILRNMIDAQYRMTRGGLAAAPSHPMEYIALVLGKRYRRGILGENISGTGTTSKTEWADDLFENLSGAQSRIGLDQVDNYQHGILSGSFPTADVLEGGTRKMHTFALIAEAKRIQAKDPYMRMAIRMRAAGKSREEIVDALVKLIDNPRNPYFKKIDAIYRGGINYVTPPMGGSAGNVVTAPQVGLGRMFAGDAESKEAAAKHLREYVDKVIYENAITYTGDLDEVRILFGYNATPRLDEGRLATITGTKEKFVGVEDLMGKAPSPDDIQPGFVARYNGEDGPLGVIISEAPNPTNAEEMVYTFVPFDKENALSGVGQKNRFKNARFGTRDAQRLIQRSKIYDPNMTPDNPLFGKGLPQKVAYEQSLYDQKNGLWESYNLVTDWFFNRLYETTSRVLERAPAFRQFYYRNIEEQVDLLSSPEARKILNDLAVKAKAEGLGVREYLGVQPVGWERINAAFKKPDDVIARLEKIANSATHKGTATAEELDDFARWGAIHDVKDLLYDVSDVWSIEESMKLIAPFVSAWKEILFTYGRFIATDNIRTVRSFQRIFTGFQQADPDNDGRGFFYTAPDTGDIMFTFPFSGNLSQELTGIYAPLEAPVKGLSQGINFYPALGPYVQFALGNIISDKPEYFDLYEFFLPYGKTTVKELATAPIPGWLRKTYSAFADDPDDMSTLYANTHAEVARALSVNPKYNLSTPEGVEQLLSDARGRARVLMLMRAASQFTGPVAGSYDIRVPTKQGDMYVTELTKELERLQNNDYDSAITNFLDMFGDDLMMYVGSKTRSAREGLETSKEFGLWELNNSELVRDYPRTASYLAPQGSGFEFSMWQRQLEEGSRVRLTAAETLKLAQERIGKVKYRRAQKTFGPYPNERQREVLALYREYLHSVLPGFPLKSEFVVNKFDNQVEELKDLIKDERITKSDDVRMVNLAATISSYLAQRDNAYKMTGGNSLKSKKATPLRYQLFAMGERMADQNPDFDRIWQRFLSAEVED